MAYKFHQPQFGDTCKRHHFNTYKLQQSPTKRTKWRGWTTTRLLSPEWKMTLDMVLILWSYIARYHLCGTVNYQTVYVHRSKKPQCSVQMTHNLLKATSFFYTFTKKCLQFPLHKDTATGTCIWWNSAPSRQWAFQVIYSSSRLEYHLIHIQILSVPDRAGGQKLYRMAGPTLWLPTYTDLSPPYLLF